MAEATNKTALTMADLIWRVRSRGVKAKQGGVAAEAEAYNRALFVLENQFASSSVDMAIENVVRILDDDIYRARILQHDAERRLSALRDARNQFAAMLDINRE